VARRDEKLDWNKEYPSPFGLMHMAGNAAEWVGDWHDAAYYRTSPIHEPQGPEKGDAHAFRGGSFMSEKADEVTTYWRGMPRDPAMKAGLSSARAGKPCVGFRCVKNLDAVKKRDETPKPLRRLTLDDLMKMVAPEEGAGKDKTSHPATPPVAR
jgi:hypothetical protein